MIEDTISKLVNDALESLDLKGEIVLEHPSDLSHGDFSCNIAMKLATGNPKELAEEIAAAIEPSEYIKEVEVKGPGFINFYLSDKFFTKKTTDILNTGNWGSNNMSKGKTILLEHSSPNLFKPFHIGHLVNNSLGESLVRITSSTGATVTPLSFPSDVSPGIAKAVWAVLDKGWEEELTIERIGEAYVHGVKSYEEFKEDIDALNKSLYNKEIGTPAWRVYEKGRKLSLEYFLEMTKRLGSEFKELIFESEAEEEGNRIVKENTPKVFQKSDGAIIFKGSEYGLFDNVFINSAGFGTYLAKDIGLLSLKFSKYDFDKSVTVTDVEQKHHFELVKKAAGLVSEEWSEKSSYIQHGRLLLTSGKISSRDGGVPLAEDILDSVKERVLKRMKDNEREMDEETAKKVAVAAVKYAIARVGMGKNITFDMETSLSLEGDTGPYIQYTYARASSILRSDDGTSTERGSLEITEVERLLYRFEEVVKRAAGEYEPHYVANYLSALSSAYNSWYAQEQVLDGSDSQGYKLAITEAVSLTLKNGLWMLGIEAPEKM